jgi:hypothetical protein
MKVLAVITAALMLTMNVQADEPSIYSNLTIAAIDTSSNASWKADKIEIKTEKLHTDALADQVEAMNEKLNAQLEQNLEAKLSKLLDH